MMTTGIIIVSYGQRKQTMGFLCCILGGCSFGSHPNAFGINNQPAKYVGLNALKQYFIFNYLIVTLLRK